MPNAPRYTPEEAMRLRPDLRRQVETALSQPRQTASVPEVASAKQKSVATTLMPHTPPAALLPVASHVFVPAIEQGFGPKLTKTELEFLRMLEARDYTWIGVQCWTLRLGFDCRFTPDFWAINRQGALLAWDVKGGHIWEDATIKIKTAARMFPFIQFYVAQKTKSEGWQETPVKT